jgi:hypothetical protein
MKMQISRGLTRPIEKMGWLVPEEVEAPELDEADMLELLWLAEAWAQATDLDDND